MMEDSERQGSDSGVKNGSQGRLKTGQAQASATGEDETVRYFEFVHAASEFP